MGRLTQEQRICFRDIIEQYLFPLFPGTTFRTPLWVDPTKRKRRKLVAQSGNLTTLKLTHHEDRHTRCQIERKQPYSTYEKEIIECFLSCIKRLEIENNQPYARDVAASLMTEVVAKSIFPTNPFFLIKLLSTLSEWAQQTYEGQRISFSMGIVKNEKGSTTNFFDIYDQDFLKVLGNGNDTLAVFDQNGDLLKHRIINDDAKNIKYYPIRFRKIANWTNNEHKVAITLNRNGEILIFKKGELCFAKRRGVWCYFPHETVVKQFTQKALGKKSSEQLRRAIYLTALDVSFARSGGCIGVVTKSNKNRLLQNKILDSSDLFFSKDASLKTKALSLIVNGKKFQNINRLIRLELASIDGAIVLAHDGEILSIGAILSVPGGSSSGGRQAATKAIAKFGLGVKISNDGYIKVLNRNLEEIIKLS